jgi:hypothetical protein
LTVGIDPVYIGFSKPGIEKGNYPYHYEFKRQFDIQFYMLKKSGKVKQIMQESYGRHLVFELNILYYKLTDFTKRTLLLVTRNALVQGLAQPLTSLFFSKI